MMITTHLRLVPRLSRSRYMSLEAFAATEINEILIIFINCNCVVTRWQWLFYMYTKYEIGY